MYFQPPQRVSLANLPTSLQPLNRLSEHLGGPKIWIKRDDLTGTTLSGNKVRKLEFVVAQALAEKASVLMTCGGVQSNHCRATALVAAELGLKCHLILRGKEPEILDGNTLLAHLAGAQISYYSPKEYSVRAGEIVQGLKDDYAKKGDSVFWTPTGASDEIGLWGYYSAAQELLSDFQRLKLNVGAVVCATGSGGTYNGLSLGFHHLAMSNEGLNLRVHAYAVCDDEDYFKKKAVADISAWFKRYHPEAQSVLPELHINDRFIGQGYGIANAGVYETIRFVAQLEGVVLDPVYTGKAFQGLISDIKAGEYSDCEHVVFVHTGGVFGLFPQRSSF